MFDQTFSYVLAIAALVIGVMLLTGHGSVFMKGGNTQARAQKYDEKKMEKFSGNLPDSYWNCHRGRCFYRKHGSKDCICGYLICDPRSFSVSSQNKMSEKII